MEINTKIESSVMQMGNVWNGISKKSLCDIDREFLKAALNKHGFLIMRDYICDVNDFTNFINTVSSEISLDPAREHITSAAQLVDAGVDAIGFHCENGNSPFWPELCWFHCIVPPKVGSQTTVCDGIELWNALSKSTRELFIGNRISYSRHVSEMAWKQYVYHTTNKSIPIEKVTFKDLKNLVSDISNVNVTLLENSDIHYRFVTYAMHKHQPTGRFAFANSLRGPSFNYEHPIISFENGDKIPEEVIYEIDMQSEELTQEINWKMGDTVLIDNYRVMHGRRKILDEKRKIVNALSNW